MATYLISFDLNKEGLNYSQKSAALSARIKATFSLWWHNLDSTWAVVSDLSAVEIRNLLSSCLDENDELLVVQSSGVAAWTGFNNDASSWLKENI